MSMCALISSLFIELKNYDLFLFFLITIPIEWTSAVILCIHMSCREKLESGIKLSFNRSTKIQLQVILFDNEMQ